MDGHNQASCDLEPVLANEGSEASVLPEEGKKNSLRDGAHRDAPEQKGQIPLSQELLDALAALPSVEMKIRFCLDQMRGALSREGLPCFRDFWAVRQQCLTFFKEPLSPKLRSQLWGGYVELSAESKRLKEILDEQSAFASEQIELAIQALEKDVENRETLLDQVLNEPLFTHSLALEEHRDFYHTTQRQIGLFNTLAARINALRKEVLKTEMRIRIKNKFLARLSLCGDAIFPKRKEWIQQISVTFKEDVDRFIASYFQEEGMKQVPLYSLREEVKQLQFVAKAVTLGNQAFTDVRLKLSHCWDQMKEKEKERRLQTQQKRQVFKQNFDGVMEKIGPFKEACEAGLSEEECHRQADEILQFMKTIELGKEEVLELKEQIFQAKRGPLEKARREDLERQRKDEEREARRREQFNQLKAEAESVVVHAADKSIDELTESLQRLGQAVDQLTTTKMEKQLLERCFKQIKESIQEKKTQALLQLPQENQQALEQLRIALEEHRLRRQDIKKQQEQYRKLLGGSGLDFEKAMLYREMIEAEKAALDKVETAMQELEQKIQELEA